MSEASTPLKLTLVVMAKAPWPGRAKTRLIPALGPRGAADLAEQMLVRTLAAARASGVGRVELCAEPEPSSPAWRRVALPEGLAYSAQGDGDLGDRMAGVSARLLASGEAVMLMGTDCVQMSPELLRRAAKALAESDAVLYPTRDGGYALLGLRRFAPEIFAGMPWSTDRVFALTRDRLQRLGWRVHLGECLDDVDQPEDLALWYDATIND